MTNKEDERPRLDVQPTLSDGGLDAGRSAVEQRECHLDIRNLGGIDDLELTVPRGISMLVGKNATNRSSVLRSLAAGLGGQASAAYLKTDADSGHVELTTGGETYSREHTDEQGAVTKSGNPYTDEGELVDTFVALFADSPTRRAVTQGENLRDILMRPVDTVDIRRQIDELKRTRSALEDEIERLKAREKELPTLEERRVRLEDRLTAVEEEIAEHEAVVEQYEATESSGEEGEQLREKLDSLRDELGSVEGRLSEIEQQLEFRREERTALLEEREEVESELAEFDDDGDLETKVQEVETAIDQHERKKQALEQAIEDLQSVIQTNETFLDEESELVDITTDRDVTAALDPESQTVECWTCGTEVGRGQITDRVETLREVVSEHRSELTATEQHLSELTAEKRSYETQRERYRTLERRLDEFEERIQRHEESISRLESEREEQNAERERYSDNIATVEAQIQALESEEDDDSEEFVAAHRKLTALERKRGRLENQLEETTEEIEEITASAERRTGAQDELAAVLDELEQLRGHIDQLEQELVDTLNTMLSDLIDLLAYENITRVWVERRTVPDENSSTFELHIVRETADGAVYEDTVETLSESEREVIGVVVAVAGYLVHDIDEEIPFLLFDSVEMIDGERLAALLEYVESETAVEFLVVALLDKDAAAVEDASTLSSYATVPFERSN